MQRRRPGRGGYAAAARKRSRLDFRDVESLYDCQAVRHWASQPITGQTPVSACDELHSKVPYNTTTTVAVARKADRTARTV